MGKGYMHGAVLALVLTALSPCIDCRAAPVDAYSGSAVFPYSLEVIDDEAFSGTAIDTVIFQENVVWIGEKAFAGDEQLRDVFIPPAVEEIGSFAFPERTGIIIHGVEGSYAETWAKEHNFPFVQADVWNTLFISANNMSTHGILASLFMLIAFLQLLTRSTAQYRRKKWSMRPEDRPELHVLDYRFP